jgi:hypothetical protein
MVMRYFILIGWLSCVLTSQVHSMPSDAEIEAWFNDDAEQRAIDVNEGELRFLTRGEEPHMHQGMNRIRLMPASLQDGWVEPVQCHEQLDAVPLAEVVYTNYVLRKLRVIDARFIDKVTLQGATVQLQGVQGNAHLCVGMEIQALQRNGANYVLRNGPFQRRFLDGYYPMHVVLEVDYAESGLIPTGIWPGEQTGVQLDDNGKRLRMDATFEGILTTRIDFQRP